MGEIRFVGTGETHGYPNLVCKKRIVGPNKTRGYHYPVCNNVFSSPLGSLIPFSSFEIILGSLMRPNSPKLVRLAQKICTLDSFQFSGVILASKG